ncbi:MAG: hypothetical protein ACXW61_08195 [Gemmatirosa sp.]
MRLRALLPLLLLLLGAPPIAGAQTQRRPVRRQPVTPELARTAFADAAARTLLDRARAARVAQDSALRGYDARTYRRMTIGLGVRRLGREHLLLRHEEAAHVRWSRGAGLWVEPTGRRTTFPMGGAQLDLTATTPIPYFPGRESLWLPFGALGDVARAEVNENELLHPLATGAEAYYTYAAGDSVGIRLPDGRRIALRELRVTARRPEWRAFVGSFWFDAERGSLVRAAYRFAAELDLWQLAGENMRRELQELEERARTDTGEVARRARAEAARVRSDLNGPGLAIAGGLTGPARANLSAVTVEYGLHDGRFWLPRLHVAEAEARGGFLRAPVRVEERFRYEGVNGGDPLAVVGTPAELGLSALDTAWVGRGVIAIGGSPATPRDSSAAARATRLDSLQRRYTALAEWTRMEAAAARARGDTARARRLERESDDWSARVRLLVRRQAGCETDSTYLAGTHTRFDGALRMAIRLPCDMSRLATSPDLPPTAFEPDEAVLGTAERDALLKALDFALQAAWSPQRPALRTGLDLVRYNRIEGLSLGAAAASALGRGYTAQAIARLGTGDWTPNGELSLARSDGRTERRLGVFHRLGVANDDWGAPLSFGASVANLLYARDQGFYYRTWGAELAGTRASTAPLGGTTILWRMFAERQRSAGREPETQASLGNAIGDARFGFNIDAASLTALGAGVEMARGFGVDPRGTRLDTRVRAEAALTDRADSTRGAGYARLVLDGTLARALGPFAGSLTGAAGMSAGTLPVQRAFHVGGLHTVRDQFAQPDGAGRVGDAFWLARAEVGFGPRAARLAPFYDVGWAGRRDDLASPGRPLSGAGVGLSLLDGLLRLDVARGIHPERRWRVDLSLGARF